MKALSRTGEGREFLNWLDRYKDEYGNKAIFSHEYVYTTWRENPAPIVAAVQGYLETDYSFPEALQRLREDRDAAIRQLMSMVRPDDAQGRKLIEQTMERMLRMMPLTPDHHFYIDQGTYARVRFVLLAIGRRLVASGLLDRPDDAIFLKYHDLRVLAANPQAIPNARDIVRDRRAAHERALTIRPREWVGTVTHWSLYEEPYKGAVWGYPQKFFDSLKREKQGPAAQVEGLPASPGVVEGTARYVDSPQEFDQVRQGEILVCKMTNPAWVVVFTKIAGLVTDSGGQLSHPAVVSREFGIPAVVGTMNATQTIKSGMRLRVNGSTGIVEILA
jgi:pyruvate,water dikinase